CAAILNIEEDHLDYYRDIEQIVEAFGAFGSLLPEDGRLIVNADDAEAVRAGSASGAVVETCGVSEGADWGVRRVRLDGGCFAFEIWRDGEVVVQTRLGIAGRHNVMNAAAAAAVAWHCGVGPEVIGRGLADFGGVRRRLTLWGRVGGVTVVDDYAHHPTEIRATLEAARQRFEPRRVWVIFQPHQHSRTRFLLADFASSFELADVVVVPDIYFVRDSQQERARICAQDLVERLQAGGKDARYVADFGEIVDAVRAEACCGDLILTMGAGDIWKVASELVRRA
ncbi:MAG: glutamate ligase domain-containing protein, partial [Phycisphaerae bacterium]